MENDLVTKTEDDFVKPRR